ncbi:MAG: DegV family protein [Dehalococcoidia bacterium]|nr:DegV family protein [Dehalococcoidia bacterium]
MTVRLVTDSTCDIPRDAVSDLGITVVPQGLLFGDEELRDGVDITSEQFFRRLQREDVMPTTTQPAPGVFRETYERLAAEGATGIVSCHVSGALSGTLQSARTGAEGLGVPVVHVDSRTVSLGLGVGVIEAAKAARDGATLEQVQRVAEDVFRRSHMIYTLETLEYLRRGGRMSRGQELFGSLLKVKPILAIQDGEVVPVGRIRTKQKAIEDILGRLAELRPWQYAYVVYGTTPDEADYITSRLDGLSSETPILRGLLTPTIGVHVGPGGVGVGCVTAPDEQSPDFLPA